MSSDLHVKIAFSPQVATQEILAQVREGAEKGSGGITLDMFEDVGSVVVREVSDKQVDMGRHDLPGKTEDGSRPQHSAQTRPEHSVILVMFEDRPIAECVEIDMI